jgi:diguanylate cyclase (GGDEF)-like protein
MVCLLQSPDPLIHSLEINMGDDSRRLDVLFETFFDITSLVRNGQADTVLYARVLDCCLELLNADRALLVRGVNSNLERYSRRRGERGSLQKHQVPGTQALLRWLEREGQPFVGPAGNWHPPLPQPLLEKHAGTVVCAPLVGMESQLGLLIAMREDEPVGFNSDDLRMLTILANQTAIALENVTLYQRLKQEALFDGLTGIYNYRSLMHALRKEIGRSDRYQQPFAFVMADVDHLKSYNERFGHLAGSEVLAEIARVLVRECRGTDVPGKYGGDEFAIILPQTGDVGAKAVSERIRASIEATSFRHVDSGEVTCSFGVAMYPRDASEMRGLIRRADQVLFEAKHSGKNTVLTTQDVPEPEAIEAGSPEEPVPGDVVEPQDATSPTAS